MMTREEAYNIDILTRTGFDTRIMVDKIYDDFESRTCENCKYIYMSLSGKFACDKVRCMVAEDFGCNKFERKTDGNV